MLSFILKENYSTPVTLHDAKCRRSNVNITWCWCVSKWIMRLIRSQVYSTCNTYSSFPWQHISEEGNEREIYELFHQTKDNSIEKSTAQKEELQATALPRHIFQDSSHTMTFFQWQLKKGCISKNLKAPFHVMCSTTGPWSSHSSQQKWDKLITHIRNLASSSLLKTERLRAPWACCITPTVSKTQESCTYNKPNAFMWFHSSPSEERCLQSTRLNVSRHIGKKNSSLTLCVSSSQGTFNNLF